jgi:hypothetical protein
MPGEAGKLEINQGDDYQALQALIEKTNFEKSVC